MEEEEEAARQLALEEERQRQKEREERERQEAEAAREREERRSATEELRQSTGTSLLAMEAFFVESLTNCIAWCGRSDFRRPVAYVKMQYESYTFNYCSIGNFSLEL